MSSESNPTAKQFEYALAPGVGIPRSPTRQIVSGLIDAAHSTLDGPPTTGQLQLANLLGVEVPDAVATRRKCTDLLYEHLVARRWVYSVLRHASDTCWRRYRESGVDETRVMQLASEIVARRRMYFDIAKKAAGNSETGADVWTRVTKSSVDSPEYLFVLERCQLVGSIQSSPAAEQTVPIAARPTQKRSQGCLLHIALGTLIVAGSIALALALR